MLEGASDWVDGLGGTPWGSIWLGALRGGRGNGAWDSGEGSPGMASGRGVIAGLRLGQKVNNTISAGNKKQVS